MDILQQIEKKRKEKNAVILAHYYVDSEVKKIADYVGDSYYLSKVAASTDADEIILCGVSFMGESAKLLNPDKHVFMPDGRADCPMAHMVTPDKIRSMRERYEDLAVVCYINSTAEIKACCDVCVTSANAVKIVKALDEHNIFFVPDGNLGSYVAGQCPEKNVILNNGYCPIHHHITQKQVVKVKNEHPNALFAAHPECTPEVLEEADYIGSTSGIIKFTVESDANEFIIGTVVDMFYELQEASPDKKFYSVIPEPACPNMRLVTLEKVLDVLENGSHEVFVEEAQQKGALQALEKMLELGK